MIFIGRVSARGEKKFVRPRVCPGVVWSGRSSFHLFIA